MKKKLSSIELFVLVVTFTFNYSITFSQTPRMVLMEEATNASCGPCAAQNPTYEAWLNRSDIQKNVIPLCYRSNYPGKDVMNAANPTMHNARVDYYSDPIKNIPYNITGVPTSICNGKIPKGNGYPGAPSDVKTFTDKINQTPKFSPITISINEVRILDSSKVTVRVKSTEKLSSKVLQIAVVEGHHYYESAGGNGEKDFYHIVRSMLPTHEGTIINLNLNEEAVINQSYSISKTWNKDEIYIVAFIQDNDSREVLQAASNQGSFEIKMDDKFTKLLEPNKLNSNWNLNLTPTNPGNYKYEINSSLPQGWTSAIKLNNNVVIDSGYIDTKSGNQFNFDVNFSLTPNAKIGKGLISILVTGTNATRYIFNFKLYSSSADVVVLSHDEGLPEILDSYMEGLNDTKYSYLPIDKEDENLVDKNNFKVVLFQSGKSIIDSLDVSYLKNLMDTKSKLLIAGAEISWGLVDTGSANRGYFQDNSFVRNYLHANYIGDTGPSFNINGKSNDPISNGMSFAINKGVPNQDTPDEIKALNEAKPIFFYGSENNNRQAGLRYADQNKYRLVYLGFGLEGISDLNKRTSVLQKSIDWLLSNETTTSVDLNNELKNSITLIGPNPANDIVAFDLKLQNNSVIDVQVLNSIGEIVKMLPSKNYSKGVHNLIIDVNNLNSGVYSVNFQIGNKNINEHFVINK